MKTMNEVWFPSRIGILRFGDTRWQHKAANQERRASPPVL